MTTATLEAANGALRAAVEERLAASPPEHEDKGGCCEGQRFRGDALMETHRHPSSTAFVELLREMQRLHLSKSADYGSEDDPLANVRSGADFVNIEPWRGCMVRIADKVQRLLRRRASCQRSFEFLRCCAAGVTTMRQGSVVVTFRQPAIPAAKIRSTRIAISNQNPAFIALPSLAVCELRGQSEICERDYSRAALERRDEPRVWAAGRMPAGRKDRLGGLAADPKLSPANLPPAHRRQGARQAE